jgi:hypothetical protein
MRLQPPSLAMAASLACGCGLPRLRLQPPSLAVAGFFNKSDLKAKYTVANEALGSGNFAVVKKATKTAKNTNAAVPAEVILCQASAPTRSPDPQPSL